MYCVLCMLYLSVVVVVVVVVCKQLMFIVMCFTGCHCNGKERLYYETVSV